MTNNSDDVAFENYWNRISANGRLRVDRCDLHEQTFKAGINHERKRSEKLVIALSDWLEWEDEQIKKEGAYVRPCINALINNGKQALKEYKSASVTDEKEGV